MIFQQITFFQKLPLCNFQGWPKGAPRRAFGAQEASQDPSDFLGSALAASKGALGELDQAHGGPFGEVPDRQKYVRALNLMVKPR